MTTLLLAEHDKGLLSEQTARALSAATAIGDEVHVLVVGEACRQAAEAAALLDGVAKVLVADHAGFAHALAEPVAALLVSLAPAYRAIAAPTTARGKDILPRAAALLDVMQISDVVEVVAPDVFRRPIYAGNAVETVQSTDPLKLFTIRSSAFPPAGKRNGAAPIETLGIAPAPAKVRFLGRTLSTSERPELATARVVVAGGRALGSAEQFLSVLAPLAKKLNAALGASRAAVDAGFAPNEWQVGQTGQVVAPDLYIAIGISGAVQHLAGMKNSRVIVAINADAEAPIMQIADYAIVGDLFEIVPALVAAL